MREIVCGDSFVELPKLAQHDTLITSMPDAAELQIDDMRDYEAWLRRAAELCFEAVPPSGLCVFYQTDRKIDGRWFSKSSTLISTGHRLLWHKIVLRREVGKRDLYRPGYTHLLAFSESGRVGSATPDVLDAGRYLWDYGMGSNAARFAVNYARSFGDSLVDPFCGYGTVLAFADQRFERVTGIDIDKNCCEHARTVQLAKRPVHQ